MQLTSNFTFDRLNIKGWNWGIMGNGKRVSETTELHQLINRERRRHGLPWNRWDQQLYLQCKKHSNDMVKRGRLYHSTYEELIRRYEHADGRIELAGIAECVSGGRGNWGSRDFFVSWMRSHAHKALILSDDLGYQAVAISRSRYGAYATWQAESDIDHSLDNELDSSGNGKGFWAGLKDLVRVLFG